MRGQAPGALSSQVPQNGAGWRPKSGAEVGTGAWHSSGKQTCGWGDDW